MNSSKRRDEFIFKFYLLYLILSLISALACLFNNKPFQNIKMRTATQFLCYFLFLPLFLFLFFIGFFSHYIKNKYYVYIYILHNMLCLLIFSNIHIEHLFISIYGKHYHRFLIISKLVLPFCFLINIIYLGSLN